MLNVPAHNSVPSLSSAEYVKYLRKTSCRASFTILSGCATTISQVSANVSRALATAFFLTSSAFGSSAATPNPTATSHTTPRTVFFTGMDISSSQLSIFWKSKTPSSPVYSSAGSGPAGDQPGWATGAALDLRGANEDRGPRRWNLAEIRHAFETPFVAAEQRLVSLELLLWPDVQRDGVDAYAGNVALRDQELAGLPGEAREVERVRLIGTQIGLGVADLRVPTRIPEHVATLVHAAL